VQATGYDDTKIVVQKSVPRPTASPGLAIREPRGLTSSASAHLDVIRALAAWAVMWGHIRGHFFVDFQHLEQKNLLLQALYFATGFGHQAVMVFFVLSGFLISSSILHSYASGRWSWLEYAINRSSRLYAVLIPGLVLGFLWDKLGSTFFSATGLYSHPLVGFGTAISQNQLTPAAFVGNLFFLQTILCPTFGSNGPLWSLANEFWYYVLFPVALAAGFAWVRRVLPRAMALTIFAGCLALFLRWDKLIGFVIWLTGTGLVLAYSRFQMTSKRVLTLYTVSSSSLLVACLVSARLGGPSVLGSDLAVGTAFALFLFAVLHMNFGAVSDIYKGSAHLFAGFSYSLYVLHFPFVLFLRAWIASPERWQPNGRHLFYGAALGTLTLFFAWAVSAFTENKTGVLRGWMRNTLVRRTA
jgi:peptidoglycan/LPS O-acetylase OafA/YrhL